MVKNNTSQSYHIASSNHKFAVKNFSAFFLALLVVLINQSPVFANNLLAQNTKIQLDDYFFTTESEPTSPPLPQQESVEIKKPAPLPKTTGPRDFVFSLTNLLIDFGELSPTNPSVRTQELSVKNTGAPSFSLFVKKDHPLQNPLQTIIPDTTCDNGMCNDTRASVWQNTLAFGFGYRCDAISPITCRKDFSTPAEFMQIPNEKDAKQFTQVATGHSLPNPSSIKITYKVNTSPSQEEGTYTNTITFLLAPGF